MERLIERVGGLDVHKQTVAACVRVPGSKGAREQYVRTFGTTAAELLALRDWLEAHGVTHVAIESPGVYWKPIYYVLEESFACLLVNPAHVKQGRAVDHISKREHRALTAAGDATLSGSKYLWLYAEENLPEQHRVRFAQLKVLTLKTGRAWALRRACASSGSTPASAGPSVTGRVVLRVSHSRLTPVIETARMIQRHLSNVMTFVAHRITNAVTEGLNFKIQTIKKIAYGFRNREHFKTAVYFHCGGLDLYPATYGEAG